MTLRQWVKSRIFEGNALEISGFDYLLTRCHITRERSPHLHPSQACKLTKRKAIKC